MSSGAAADTASSYRRANSARLAPGTGPGSTINPSVCNAYAASDESCVSAEIDANQLSIITEPERYRPRFADITGRQQGTLLKQSRTFPPGRVTPADENWLGS